MYALERQRVTTELVEEYGRVSVKELAARFGVTAETIRRDLEALEAGSLLERVHGGAVRIAARPTSNDVPAWVAAALKYQSNPHGSMLLGAGRLGETLASGLPPDRPGTVVTNSLAIAAQLAGSPAIALRILPGQVCTRSRSIVGEDLVEALARLRVDVAYIEAGGISPRFGLSAQYSNEAHVKRAMVASARQLIVLSEPAALGRELTERFADMRDVDLVITTTGAADSAVAAVQGAGVEVVIA